MIEVRANVTEWDIDLILAYFITNKAEFPVNDGQCYMIEK